MNLKSALTVLVAFFAACHPALGYPDAQPQAFLACLKRTQYDRAACESDCGMILHQCYEEANDAIEKNIAILLDMKSSNGCFQIAKNYNEMSFQLIDKITSLAASQSHGWLEFDLKMKLLQQRYEIVKLLHDTCK